MRGPVFGTQLESDEDSAEDSWPVPFHRCRFNGPVQTYSSSFERETWLTFSSRKDYQGLSDH